MCTNTDYGTDTHSYIVVTHYTVQRYPSETNPLKTAFKTSLAMPLKHPDILIL